MHLISHKQFNNERIIIKIDQKNLKLFMNEQRIASNKYPLSVRNEDKLLAEVPSLLSRLSFLFPKKTTIHNFEGPTPKNP